MCQYLQSEVGIAHARKDGLEPLNVPLLRLLCDGLQNALMTEKDTHSHHPDLQLRLTSPERPHPGHSQVLILVLQDADGRQEFDGVHHHVRHSGVDGFDQQRNALV